MQARTTTKNFVEVSYVLLGEFNNGIWHAKLSWKTSGTHSTVNFAGDRALAREEKSGDVVGFYHTHPDGLEKPSGRDDRTMKAWSFCFGKPLLCAIETSAGLKAWSFDYRLDEAIELRVSLFKSKWIVAALE